MNSSRPLSPGAALLIVLLLTLAVFWPVVTFDFVSWDDYETVARNPRLNPPTQQGLISFWTQPRMDLYVPLTYTVWSFVANAAPQAPYPPSNSSLNPRAFHALNLLLHLAAAAMAFALLLEMFAGATLPAMIGAMLFALHPVQVESVAWVSGMKDVLCGLLPLLALWQYLRFARLDKAGAAIEVPAEWGRAYAFATIAFVLALLAKPSAMVVPAVAIILDFLIVRRKFRQIIVSAGPWLILSIACAYLAKHLQPAPHAVADVPSLWARPLVAADALGFYLTKLFWPAKLAFDYGRTPQVAIEQKFLYALGAIPLLIAGIIAWARRESGMLLAAIMIFLVCLAPMLGLVPFDFQSYSTVADHYLYLAMIGPAIAAAWFIRRFQSRPIALTFAAVALLALGTRTYFQTWHWRGTDELLHHALDVNPSSFASYNSLAAARLEAGDPRDAVELAEKAIKLRPSIGSNYYTLGLALSRLDDVRGAVEAYRTALQYEPEDPRPMANLAAALAERGELPEALSLAKKSVAIDPSDAAAHVNLGTIYARLGQVPDAIREYRLAVGIAPRNLRARTNLGMLLAQTGRTTEAADELRAALRIDPDFRPAREALDQLPPPDGQGSP